jgi:hypothetical protein
MLSNLRHSQERRLRFESTTTRPYTCHSSCTWSFLQIRFSLCFYDYVQYMILVLDHLYRLIKYCNLVVYTINSNASFLVKCGFGSRGFWTEEGRHCLSFYLSYLWGIGCEEKGARKKKWAELLLLCRHCTEKTSRLIRLRQLFTPAVVVSPFIMYKYSTRV